MLWQVYKCLLDYILRPLPLNRPARLRIGCNVSAPEAVDRLFRVPDHEQRSGAQGTILPVHRAIFRRDPEEDLRLDRIGVLEFVDENVTIAFPKRAPHIVMLAHQPPRLFEEV